MMFLAALAMSAVVWAQSPEEKEQRARDLYENGAILYDEGRYEDAIVAWEEAHALSERPLLLYNIASAQERLGKWQEALDTLNRYRAFAEPDERDRLDRRITNLERRLAEEAELVTPPTDTPVTVVVPPEGPLPTISEPYTGPRTKWLAPTSLAIGGVGVAAGTVFALRTVSARQEALSLCVEQSSGLLCPSTVEDLLRQDQVSSLATDVAFAVGGIGLLGGAALMIWTDAPVVPAPGGILLRGQF